MSESEKQRKLQEDKPEYQRQSSSELDEDSEEESVQEFQLNEHIDCCDTVNKWLDAEIIAVFSKKDSFFFNHKNYMKTYYLIDKK